MTKHLFLTGRKGVGKSTLIRGLLAAESGPLGGFFTVKYQGGVYLLPAAGEGAFTPENLLFYCGHGGDPRRFDDLGCAALADTAGCGLLVMDELGPHEAEAVRFQAAVFRALEGDIPILGVLQQKAVCAFPRRPLYWLQKRTPGSAGGRKKPMARGEVDKKKSPS